MSLTYCSLRSSSEGAPEKSISNGLVSCTVHPLKVNRRSGAFWILLLSATALDRPTSW